MTEQQQQRVSELLNEKSKLNSDLATLYDNKSIFSVCFNWANSFTYNIGFNCNRNKELIEQVKNTLITLLQKELDIIEEELKQL